MVPTHASIIFGTKDVNNDVIYCGKEEEPMGAAAGARAVVYGLFVGIFAEEPGKNLLKQIQSKAFDTILNELGSYEDQGIQAGIDAIRSYLAKFEKTAVEDIFAELAVDWTRIIRGAGLTRFNPPYEGLYLTDSGAGNAALALKRLYRHAGLMPAATVTEPADFLGIELDFMRKLCLREQQQWRTADAAMATVAEEKRFLSKHLGRWVGRYCEKASACAVTSFYQGFLCLLAAIIELDTKFVDVVLASTEAPDRPGH
jgi:TorA maturation chaperone TorD